MLHLIPVLLLSLAPVADTTITEPFKLIEHPPEYPGGAAALGKLLYKNIHYPEDAKKRGAEGIITVGFTLDEKGHAVDIKPVGPPQDSSLEKEAVRVMGLMRRWKPGTQNGKPVKVEFKLPIKFSLPAKKQS